MSDFVGVAFAEAIAYLKDRLGISDIDWQELLQAADDTAQRIVEETASSMRRDLLEAISAIFEAGGTARDFREKYEDITRSHGWSTDAGKPGWHSDLIWRMEVFGARAAGRWEQAQRLHRAAPHMGYCFRYVTVGDHRVRDSHAKMHGIILPVTHAHWHTHFPPNGFNCRCMVTIVSRRDLVRYGWTITPDDDPALSAPPDPGFENNVGMAWDSLRDR